MAGIQDVSGIAAFRSDLLQTIYAALYTVIDDNFDYQRFNFDGVDRSKSLNIKGNAANLEFILAHIESFYAASLLFSDAESRELYLQLLRYRCLGHPHLRIREDMTWSTIKGMLDHAATYEIGPSAIKFNGLFGPLKHHENVPTEERQIALDVWNSGIAYGLGRGNHRQYYFDRGGVRIMPASGDYVIDGGACFGDTGVFFACSAGPDGRVYSFEPLPNHVNIIAHNIDQNRLDDRVFIVPAGVGEVSNNVERIDPELGGLANPGFSMTTVEDVVPVLSIDDLLALQGLDKMDFIKMDVEGFELKALKGATRTLERHRPKLAISLYHKFADFFEIPIYLKTRYPFYRLYLDHYTIFHEETVLYAIADPAL